MTSVTIIGNLSNDPELKFTPSGKAVASFTVISSKSKKNESGSWENTDVTFWNIKAWDKLGENIADSLRKGVGVIVNGSAVQENWEDKTTGQQRSRIVVTAWSVGADLKRHSYEVPVIQRSDAQFPPSKAENDPWSAPSTSGEDFPF